MRKKAVNSLERLQAVLEVFTEERLEWTPEELMEELGYSRPTLYRYLKILKEGGFLTSMPNTGFTLGPRVVEMDYLLRKSDNLILSGAPYLQKLTGKYECTALLVRWYGEKILCVESLSSSREAISSYPRGRPMPLSRGAIGRSIVAFLPRRNLLPLLKRTLGEWQAAGVGHTVEQVLEVLKSVRKTGYAVAYGEVTPGVIGFAAPIFDAGQSPIASFSLTIGEDLADGPIVEKIGDDVRQAAADISASLASHRHKVLSQ
ncbi:IclR family transcriptional regulator [Rhizobium terrae]|uniref:IclR family transcriptional regulator n=1 Tax=Rhizobium terrae TaxID=2171756 RepID=UPI000E3BC210|nr:IclR family transcriptional regulator [Rhizobium terrae]